MLLSIRFGAAYNEIVYNEIERDNHERGIRFFNMNSQVLLKRVNDFDRQLTRLFAKK